MKKIFCCFVLGLLVVSLKGQGVKIPRLRVKIEKVTGYENKAVHCWGIAGSDTIYFAVYRVKKESIKRGTILQLKRKKTDKPCNWIYRKIKIIKP